MTCKKPNCIQCFVFLGCLWVTIKVEVGEPLSFFWWYNSRNLFVRDANIDRFWFTWNDKRVVYGNAFSFARLIYNNDCSMEHILSIRRALLGVYVVYSKERLLVFLDKMRENKATALLYPLRNSSCNTFFNAYCRLVANTKV